MSAKLIGINADRQEFCVSNGLEYRVFAITRDAEITSLSLQYERDVHPGEDDFVKEQPGWVWYEWDDIARIEHVTKRDGFKSDGFMVQTNNRRFMVGTDSVPRALTPQELAEQAKEMAQVVADLKAQGLPIKDLQPPTQTVDSKPYFELDSTSVNEYADKLKPRMSRDWPEVRPFVRIEMPVFVRDVRLSCNMKT